MFAHGGGPLNLFHLHCRIVGRGYGLSWQRTADELYIFDHTAPGRPSKSLHIPIISWLEKFYYKCQEGAQIHGEGCPKPWDTRAGMSQALVHPSRDVPSLGTSQQGCPEDFSIGMGHPRRYVPRLGTSLQGCPKFGTSLLSKFFQSRHNVIITTPRSGTGFGTPLEPTPQAHPSGATHPRDVPSG